MLKLTKSVLLQAKEEVDKLQQLMKDRSSLAFGSALVCSHDLFIATFLG